MKLTGGGGDMKEQTPKSYHTKLTPETNINQEDHNDHFPSWLGL